MKKTGHLFIGSLILSFILLFACESDELKEPEIGLNNKIIFKPLQLNSNFRSIVASCIIENSNSQNITSQGFCYDIKSTPDIYGSNTTGSLNDTIMDLIPGTNYYVRAYLKFNNIIIYSLEDTIKTLDILPPVLSTNKILNITSVSAQSGGEITLTNGSDIISQGICWSKTENPTIQNNLVIDTVGGDKFNMELHNLTFNTTYFIRAFATNEAGTSYGNEISFTTKNGLSSVITSDIQNITINSAISGGNITTDGDLPVTSRGVCWSESNRPTIKDNITSDGNGIGEFTSSLTDLKFNTTYYVRAYAINEAGTVYGSELSFKTNDGLATIKTNEESNLTANSVKLGGVISSDGGFPVTSRGVCWSTSSLPEIDDNLLTSGDGTGEFTVDITGLSLNTKYYVRAFATNEAGTVYGSELSFMTNDGLATIKTNDESNLTASSVKIGGVIISDGGFQVTSRGVCWSTSSLPEIDDNLLTSGDGIGEFTVDITGLSMNTQYYVRAYAVNEAGTVYGDEISFTTESGIVIIITNDVSDITTNSAIASGNIESDGGLNILDQGVCWSISPEPDLSDDFLFAETSTNNFVIDLFGLKGVTTYYLRAFVINSNDTVFGNEKQFTTSAGKPSVSTSPVEVESITHNSAMGGGIIVDNGGSPINEHGLVWSESPEPTISNFSGRTSLETATDTFTSKMASLKSSTIYFVRAYATNSEGTSYGNEISFTTLEKNQYPFELVSVSGGTFTMGCTSEQSYCLENEKPTHKVTLNSYKIGKYEITNKQYADFLYEIGATIEGWKEDVMYISLLEPLCQIKYEGSMFVPDSGKENYPVLYVTWTGAKAYCEYYGGRLPTEAEWEFAARGGADGLLTTYAGTNIIEDVGWYFYNSENQDNVLHRDRGTFPVGTKQPNELGIYDMTGNVYEWCIDNYELYTSEDQINPVITTSGFMYAIRGGSYHSIPEDSRVTSRFYAYTQGNDEVGFRIVFE